MTARTRLFSRFAWFGIVLFGIGITALGVWSAWHTLHEIENAKRLVTLSDGWKEARFWIAEEETLERKYRIERVKHDGYYHQKIVTLFTRTVLRLRPISTAADNARIDSLLELNARYVAAMRSMFRAVDDGDDRRVEAIHEAIDPTYDRVEHITVAQETLYNRSAYLSLARLQKTQRFVATAFAMLAFIGLLAVVAFSFVIRDYRRKNDELAADQVALLERAALADALTGLGNSRAFQTKLARTPGSSLTMPVQLALIDVDCFKEANDRFGHLHGDNVLRALGALLAALPEAACAYRIGGDEFAIVFEGVVLAAALGDLKHMHRQAASRLYGNTLSVGIASLASETEMAVLQERADVALYEAKHRGRDQIVVFEPSLLDTSTSLGARRVMLDRLLASPEFGDVVFQAIWAYDGGALLGYEALSRFFDDFSSTLETFAVAERLDRAHELDARCIETIAARVPANFIGSLYVKMSPSTLLHGDVAIRTLGRLSAITCLAPERIVVELSERIVLKKRALESVSQMRALGYRVALDDTGSGNAGIAILAEMEIDIVKIDARLITTLCIDQRSRAILSGIFLMIKGLGCNVIVNGIETREDIRLCGELADEHEISSRLALQGRGLGTMGSTRDIGGVLVNPALRHLDSVSLPPGDRRASGDG